MHCNAGGMPNNRVMKILQVITSLHTGGAEKLIVDMVPKYRQHGLDVDVLLFDGTETPFKQQLESAGVKVFSLGRGGSVYNPLYLFKLLPYLRKYDIVHTHNTACQLFAAIGSVLCSVVLCTTEHTTSNRRRGLKWYRSIDKWMYSRYKKIICISPSTEDNLRESIHDYSDKICTIPNGIDIANYAIASSVEKDTISKNPERKVIAMVAGFRYQKDQETVIRAMTLLPENTELWLVGDGERRTLIEQYIKQYKLENRVLLLGIRSDVSSILKTVDIVVQSSHWEGFGLAAVEGMAAGKPVVATDVAGLSQVVEGAGILFPLGNEKKLANILKHLLSDEKYYNSVAEQCQLRAKQYDIVQMVDSYHDIYVRLISTVSNE